MPRTTEIRTAVIVLVAALSVSATALPAAAEAAVKTAEQIKQEDCDSYQRMANSAHARANQADAAGDAAEAAQWRAIENGWTGHAVDLGCSWVRTQQLQNETAQVQGAEQSPTTTGPKGSAPQAAGSTGRR